MGATMLVTVDQPRKDAVHPSRRGRRNAAVPRRALRANVGSWRRGHTGGHRRCVRTPACTEHLCTATSGVYPCPETQYVCMTRAVVGACVPWCVCPWVHRVPVHGHTTGLATPLPVDHCQAPPLGLERPFVAETTILSQNVPFWYQNG